MKINRAYRYELKPNIKQHILLAKHAGAARFTYNRGLAQRIELYQQTGKSTNARTQHRELNALKPTDFPWMYEVSKCAPQEALRDLDRAFQNFFRGLKSSRKVGYPKFKKKGQHDSFRLTGSIQVTEHHIQLPRLGKVRSKERTAVAGRILSATVTREVDRWYVSLAVETEIPNPVPVDGPTAGIDVGINHFAVISSGGELRRIVAPKPLAKYLRRLQHLSRQHSRKQKGSKNRRKSAQRLARLHRRIRNIRNDFLHKLSTELAKTKSVIVVEDLNVAGMKRNHNLARQIADAGWSEFRRMLAYKAKWYGSRLQLADRFYPSSKTCYDCGHILDKLPMHIREWDCPSCGVHHDRDGNAAQNLEALAS